MPCIASEVQELENTGSAILVFLIIAYNMQFSAAMEGPSNTELEVENRKLRDQLARLEALIKEAEVDDQIRLYNREEEIMNLPPLKKEELTREKISRYSRHLLLEEVGVEGKMRCLFFSYLYSLYRPGQIRICAASVLVVGAGGLGAPIAIYLAGAGVGTPLAASFFSVWVISSARVPLFSWVSSLFPLLSYSTAFYSCFPSSFLTSSHLS